MEVHIIDAAPSLGASLRLKEMRSQREPGVLYVPDFLGGTRSGDPLHNPTDLSRSIERSVAKFIDILGDGEMQGANKVIFDGSPITLRALGTIAGVKPDESSLGMLRELGVQYAGMVNLCLMMPAPGYRAPLSMRSFDPNKIIPLSQVLRSAYANRGFKPKIECVQESPYLALGRGGR